MNTRKKATCQFLPSTRAQSRCFQICCSTKMSEIGSQAISKHSASCICVHVCRCMLSAARCISLYSAHSLFSTDESLRGFDFSPFPFSTIGFSSSELPLDSSSSSSSSENTMESSESKPSCTNTSQNSTASVDAVTALFLKSVYMLLLPSLSIPGSIYFTHLFVPLLSPLFLEPEIF